MRKILNILPCVVFERNKKSIVVVVDLLYSRVLVDLLYSRGQLRQELSVAGFHEQSSKNLHHVSANEQYHNKLLI